MRWINCFALVVLLTIPLSSRGADDAAAAQSILDRALEAHGGAEALAKSRQIVRQVAGTMNFLGKDLAFTAEEIMDLPNRFRAAFELSVAGQKYL
jgi:hypothetical protein